MTSVDNFKINGVARPIFMALLAKLWVNEYALHLTDL
jgi:hypothetical protein